MSLYTYRRPGGAREDLARAPVGGGLGRRAALGDLRHNARILHILHTHNTHATHT